MKRLKFTRANYPKLYRYLKSFSKEYLSIIEDTSGSYLDRAFKALRYLRKFKADIYTNGHSYGLVEKRKWKGYKFISYVYTEPPFRNQGGSSKLLNDLHRKYKRIALSVHKKNPNAFRLYKKLNFQIIEERKNLYIMAKS